MKPILLISLIAAVACAQDTQALRVHGIIYEVGPNAPLAGAQITLYQFDHDRVRTAVASIVTGATGEFQFTPANPGDYYVEAAKGEFVAGLDNTLFNATPPSTTGTLINLGQEHPSEELRFALMRPGEVRGKVADDDGKPVSRLMVELIPLTLGPLPGLLSQSSLAGRTAITGTDGEFHASAVVPGKYIVRVSRGLVASKPPKNDFSAKEEEAVDQEFATLYWPGVPERSASSIEIVNPAGVTDIGSIMVRKEPQFRIHFLVKGCEPGDRLSLKREESADLRDGIIKLETLNDLVGRPTAALDCSDVLVSGLRPGSYRFTGTTKHSAGTTSVVITDRNVTAALSLVPNGDVLGRVLTVSGVPPPPVTFRNFGKTPIRSDAQGNFALTDVQCLPGPLLFAPMRPGHYVKEIRVGGVAVPRNQIPLCAGSRIEIVLDDRVATINLSVTDGDKAAAGQTVMVRQLPDSAMDVQPRRKTDESGTARLEKLAPGDYEILAVRKVALPDGDDIQRIAPQLWDRATKVTVGENETKAVAVKLIDPFER